MRRRYACAALLLLLPSCDSGGGASRERTHERLVARPHVLLVVLDTTRRDRLGAYGYERPTTPALDRLAADGVVYEAAVSAGSWTLPSHASIFTGLFPRDHGTTVENWMLLQRFETLAEVLRDDGYATVGVCSNPWVSGATGLQQGFQRFEEIWRERKADPRDEHGAALVTERLLAWLDARGAQAPPFFAFVNYLEPHTPYRPPEPFRSRFLREGTSAEAVREVLRWETPREFGYMLGVPGYEISDAELAALHDLYDAEVAYQDARFGELIDGLEARGLLDDTLVVVVADHGEQLGEHGMLDHKMSLYDENVLVPLILRYPPALPRGARIAAGVQTNDVFATVLALTGSEHEPPAAARPLPLDDVSGRPYAFVDMARPQAFMALMEREWPGADVRAFDRTIRSIRGPRFKYVWGSDGERKLYDLERDPREQTDLAGTLPEVEARLDALLAEFHAGAFGPQTAPVELDEEHLEALRSLGYVN